MDDKDMRDVEESKAAETEHGTDDASCEEEEEVEIEFPQRFYDKGLEPPGGRSIVYNSIDNTLFAALQKALKKDEWKYLWDSPVGIVLKFYKLDFGWASRLVHHFLTFQLVCDKKYEIWTLIGRNPMRFSLLEFESITGLKCDYVEDLETPDVPVTDAMKAFWKKMNVSVKKGPSVDELMQCLGVCGSWTREERIRLGYLAIYVNVFEGLGRNTASKLRLARLAMDPAAFEGYAWGRVAFKKLVESVKAKDLTRYSYTIEGFVQVLQVWTYFALPEFGSEFGDPLPNNPTPHLIAYQGSRGRKKVKDGMLKQKCFNNFVTKPSYEEMWPEWDDEVEDERIENIVRAYYGQFGSWKFTEEMWPEKGVKVSNIVKLESADGGDTSGQKVAGGGDFSSVVQLLKDHMDESFTSFSGTVTAAINGCESKILDLTHRVGYMEKSLKAMEKSVKAVVNAAGGNEPVLNDAGVGIAKQVLEKGGKRKKMQDQKDNEEIEDQVVKEKAVAEERAVGGKKDGKDEVLASDGVSKKSKKISSKPKPK